MVKRSIISTLLAFSLWLSSGLVGPVALADCPQWMPIISPGGGWIYDLVLDPSNPNTLYAGKNGEGVFKSTNGGDSWHPINSGLTNLEVRALVIDPTQPQTLYAGTGGGVFKSTDGGSSWSAVNTGLTNLKVWALAIDPLRPNWIYAGTHNGGVFKSTNGGGNWT
jgi:photosystem II stability/assembly factor-like uncharacterized protein